MKSSEFCCWLQGFLELADPKQGITAAQTEIIKRHMALVFKYEIDPSYGDKETQRLLDAIHNPLGVSFNC